MKIKYCLFLVCILTISACGAPSAAPILPTIQISPQTEAFAPTPTFTPPSTPTFKPTATLTLTPPPPLVSFSPILFRRYVDRYYSFQVLGGFQDGAWITDSESYNQMHFEKPYDVYGLNGFIDVVEMEDYFGVVGATSVEIEPYCGAYYISSNLGGESQILFGFVQGWNVTIRPFTEIAVDTPIYQQAVAEWLISQGIAQPDVQITRILRTDIEGDGADEVFISATRFKNPLTPLTEIGDYSIVLMRKVSGSGVVTVPLATDVYYSVQPEPMYPYTYLLSSFMDLNQDGNLEVILDVARWEGSGIIIYEVKDRAILQTIKEICSE
jgi:hypothetical protein